VCIKEVKNRVLKKASATPTTEVNSAVGVAAKKTFGKLARKQCQRVKLSFVGVYIKALAIGQYGGMYGLATHAFARNQLAGLLIKHMQIALVVRHSDIISHHLWATESTAQQLRVFPQNFAGGETAGHQATVGLTYENTGICHRDSFTA
jgi:hypothetical protein